MPIDGAGGLTNIPAEILGSLVARGESSSKPHAQLGSSTTGSGGSFDLGEGSLRGFVAGLASVPDAAAVVFGAASNLPGLIGTVQAPGGILAREHDNSPGPVKHPKNSHPDAL